MKHSPEANGTAPGHRTKEELRSLVKAGSAGLQIAPISSISAGVSIKPDSAKFSGPKIDLLAKEFFDGRKPGFVPKASAV